MYGFLDRSADASSPRTKLAVAAGDSSMLLRIEYNCTFAWMYSANWTAPPSATASRRGRSCHTRIAGFSREGHQRVCVEYSGLVVGRLEDGGATHGGFGGGDEGKVLAGDS